MVTGWGTTLVGSEERRDCERAMLLSGSTRGRERGLRLFKRHRWRLNSLARSHTSARQSGILSSTASIVSIITYHIHQRLVCKLSQGGEDAVSISLLSGLLGTLRRKERDGICAGTSACLPVPRTFSSEASLSINASKDNRS